MAEQWVDIVGYEGLYQISDRGRVKSLSRADCRGNTVRERILKRQTGPNGYAQVSLYREGVSKTSVVRTLVLEHFVGPAPAGTQCAHDDGDRMNPALCNLSWKTPKDNSRDKKRHGTENVGERNGQARLTRDVVQRVRQRLRDGESQQSIADQLGVSQSTISRAARRETWSCVVEATPW